MKPKPVRLIAITFIVAVIGCANVWAAENQTASTTAPSAAADALPKKSGLLPEKLGIASADLPPAGRCRIWYPGRAATQQPAPGDCDELAKRVPAGAWLLARPATEPDKVHVIVYDQSEPGFQATIGVFEAASGRFVRELAPKTNENQQVAKPPGARTN
jgi:hypothetical protein